MGESSTGRPSPGLLLDEIDSAVLPLVGMMDGGLWVVVRIHNRVITTMPLPLLLLLLLLIAWYEKIWWGL